MWFLNLLQFWSNERCSHEDCLFKGGNCWEWILLKFNFISCFCSPIFLNYFSWCDLFGQYWCHIYLESCLKEVGVFLSFSGFCIYYLEVTLMRDIISSINFLSWVHGRFMWMVHEIFHARVLKQYRQVLVVHSYTHWGILWDIEYHSEFWQWCAWVYQPSDLGVPNVISQFASVLIQWEV